MKVMEAGFDGIPDGLRPEERDAYVVKRWVQNLSVRYENVGVGVLVQAVLADCEGRCCDPFTGDALALVRALPRYLRALSAEAPQRFVEKGALWTVKPLPQLGKHECVVDARTYESNAAKAKTLKVPRDLRQDAAAPRRAPHPGHLRLRESDPPHRRDHPDHPGAANALRLGRGRGREPVRQPGRLGPARLDYTPRRGRAEVRERGRMDRWRWSAPTKHQYPRPLDAKRDFWSDIAQLHTRSAPSAEGRCSSTTARAPLASSGCAAARGGPSDVRLSAPAFFSATDSRKMAPGAARNRPPDALGASIASRRDKDLVSERVGFFRGKARRPRSSSGCLTGELPSPRRRPEYLGARVRDEFRANGRV